jgi:tetratricopeptide (TPR) repeat protein
MAERAVGRPLSPREVSAYWTGRAVDYVRSEPGDWLRLMGRKVLLLLSAVELMDAEDQYLVAESSAVLRATGLFGHFGVLAPLAVLGVFVSWPRRRELWWIFAAIAAYTASVLIFYVVTRYRYPLVPFLALLAGAGLAGAREWLASRSRREIAVCLALMMSLAVLSTSVSGMPKHSMAAVTHLNLGDALRAKGQHERAVEHYEKARALDPRLGSVGVNLASALLELRRPEEARSILEQGLAVDPQDAVLHRSLAGLLRAEGESERALVHYRRAAELLEARAAANAAEGRFGEAVAGAREALALYAAAGEPVPQRLSEALARYERGAPPRR